MDGSGRYLAPPCAPSFTWMPCAVKLERRYGTYSFTWRDEWLFLSRTAVAAMGSTLEGSKSMVPPACSSDSRTFTRSRSSAARCDPLPGVNRHTGRTETYRRPVAGSSTRTVAHSELLLRSLE